MWRKRKGRRSSRKICNNAEISLNAASSAPLSTNGVQILWGPNGNYSKPNFILSTLTSIEVGNWKNSEAYKFLRERRKIENESSLDKKEYWSRLPHNHWWTNKKLWNIFWNSNQFYVILFLKFRSSFQILLHSVAIYPGHQPIGVKNDFEYKSLNSIFLRLCSSGAIGIG